jgi:hypothetical protein
MAAATVLAACDPTFAVVLENRSSTSLVVARQEKIRGGDDRIDVVAVPPKSRTTLGTFGVGSFGILQQVTIMTETCEVLSDELLTEGFEEGGLVVVDESLDVVYEPGGNPSVGSDPELTTVCMPTDDPEAPR